MISSTIYFSWFSLTITLASITCFILSYFVYTHIRRDSAHIYYVFILIAMGVWCLDSSLISIFPYNKFVISVAQIFHLGGVFSPYFFLLYTLHVTEDQSKVFSACKIISGITALILIYMNFKPDMLIKSIDLKHFYIPFHSAGKYYSFFVSFSFFNGIIGCLALYKNIKRKTNLIRTQLIYILIAAIVMYSAGVNYYLFVYNYEVKTMVGIFVILSNLVITYAILRHKLMNIQVAIKKSLVYSILITIITSLYLIAVLITEKLFQGFAGYKSLPATLIVAFIIAIGFNPIRSRLQRFIDRHFFRGSSQAMQEHIEKLEEEVKRAEQLKIVGTLAASIAHEIRNPLTSIKTFTEILPEKINDKVFLEKLSNIVPSEVGRINNLFNQLLTFSRPSTPYFEDVDIKRLLDNSTILIENQCTQRNISIVKNYAEGKVIIKADPNQIKQAILNLFLNAMDALENVTNKDKRLIITVKPNNKSVKISIEDTGTGILEKELKHIFDLFYSTKEKGTGLGLFIVHRIIESNNGKISVRSKLGEGTTFTLEFPSAFNF